ncbi:nucleoplasmin-like protein ANO39 isoform X2 [Anneissia japonica]|uniref:nucleoplasmin-like protein ANO39 isoform X2 n=1 Tax=Anneissia japonica TaxID=1529436 RepID=UPI00142584E0|nr:nucleoplasmin-like protein ANO39 isoform X2 [Anneissia japonica]
MAINKEYFWAGQLSKKKPSITWDPKIGDEDDDDSFEESAVQHFLFLKQAVLGTEAKDGERNVVQVASEDIDGETIKQPLFSLKIGLNECTTLDVGFQPPVTFSLVSGNGPIYMSGQHALELQDDKLDDFDDEDDEDEVVEEEGDIQEMLKSKKRKRPIDTPSDINKKKQPKLDQSASSGKTSDDEDDDDDEDDEDFEMEDDDDEDDDDSEEEDDDDEDEDDEEDEDEEEEKKATKVQKKPAKKLKKNSKVNGEAKAEVKTAGGGDAKGKGTQKKKGGKPQTIQEIKDDITKSPGKPKKEAKFFNYVKNTYRITDTQKLQELWNWHKNTNL